MGTATRQSPIQSTLLHACEFIDTLTVSAIGSCSEARIMAARDSFVEWLSQLQSGDDAAVREVFQRFSRRLIGLARKQFNAMLRNKVDPEDVVQSVYKSFFLRYGEGKLHVESWDNLW